MRKGRHPSERRATCLRGLHVALLQNSPRINERAWRERPTERPRLSVSCKKMRGSGFYLLLECETRAYKARHISPIWNRFISRFINCDPLKVTFLLRNAFEAGRGERADGSPKTVGPSELFASNTVYMNCWRSI